MASEIEYRHVALKFSVAEALAAQERLAGFNAEEARYWPSLGDRPLIFVEHGASNTFDYNNRPAKSWSLCYYGQDVMRQVIHASVSCEGGMTKMKGREILPENYIKHYRDLVKRAPKLDTAYMPLMQFELSSKFVAEGEDNWDKKRMERHPFTQYLLSTGALVVQEITRYGQTEVKPVLTVKGDSDLKLACVEWLMSVAGNISRASYERDFSLSCSALGTWCEDQLNAGQRALFEDAAA